VDTPPSLEFFLERDEDKLKRAKGSIEAVKLVDRGYLSTLTFYSVLEEQEGISAEPVFKWYANEIGRKLYKPDHYIMVNVPGEVTTERAKSAKRAIHENNMWLKFPERIAYWYNKLLAKYESNIPKHLIDGNRNPSVVTEEFKDLLSDIRKGSSI